jgi:hypothetical protein
LIAAIGYPHLRLKPDSRTPQNFEDALTPRERYREREPGTAQNPGNLGIDRGRECEYVDFFSAEQRAFRNAVRLQRSTYEGRGVKNDQSAVRRSRRSAL